MRFPIVLQCARLPLVVKTAHNQIVRGRRSTWVTPKHNRGTVMEASVATTSNRTVPSTLNKTLRSCVLSLLLVIPGIAIALDPADELDADNMLDSWEITNGLNRPTRPMQTSMPTSTAFQTRVNTRPAPISPIRIRTATA